MKIEVMDTTLRDGEQTTGVSFNEGEKLAMARLLLEEIKVDRIEVASARVSEGEFAAVKGITEWARKNNCLEKIEVLGFVDGDISLNWIKDAGGKVINLLTKGSKKHVQGQLRKTPEQHMEDVAKVVSIAEDMGITVNVYLEDWSNGMLTSPEYVFYVVGELKKMNVKRIMLPDTLGVLNPDQSFAFCSDMVDRFPDTHFDFHAHNDYDMAVANVFSALKTGISGIHTTVNGLGERAGNAPLASVIGILNDHLNLQNSLDESKITTISKVVEQFSGLRIPENQPITGYNVFTQCSGVHADGDSKDNLYFNNLMPERFGRNRRYALGKTSGKANIKKNLEELGIELSPEHMKKVTQKVIELGDKKKIVTIEDLPFIIADVLKSSSVKDAIKIRNYNLSLAHDLRPLASISMEINGKRYDETAVGDGQYDAFMRALWRIYKKLDKVHPILVDYWVSIPPGGKTDALVETMITWDYKGVEIKSRGLSADQTEAAIEATVKVLNVIEEGSLTRQADWKEKLEK
ncbi:alpha-isopropylmalate synthase regulatory domain-containing protein [Plebeiibacterium marinum]|uniref:2-isopropylmalate synthase n=1 Tax=Plebeiibacterium marinum TaxID=2992111 RepID=A0AAE3MC74_9BACT|nr:alpha-isopropylmalate synthase regulatory domain-containing protein [Plebeiobacterium marinum]MCW3805233.1 2-isopropylmalate synthase [Plebeiobacterium marinum]